MYRTFVLCFICCYCVQVSFVVIDMDTLLQQVVFGWKVLDNFHSNKKKKKQENRFLFLFKYLFLLLFYFLQLLTQKLFTPCKQRNEFRKRNEEEKGEEKVFKTFFLISFLLSWLWLKSFRLFFSVAFYLYCSVVSKCLCVNVDGNNTLCNCCWIFKWKRKRKKNFFFSVFFYCLYDWMCPSVCPNICLFFVLLCFPLTL